MRRVVAFVPDLMDRSRISAGRAVTFVSTPGELADTARAEDIVIVDLSRPGVLDVLPHLPATTLGFASHVDRELISAARRAGCTQVLVRSAFFSRLPELLV